MLIPLSSSQPRRETRPRGSSIRGQQAGTRVKNQGLAGSRYGADAAPLVHLGTTDGSRLAARPEPGSSGRQCPPGGAAQAARPRPPDTGCSSPAEGQRREGAGSDCQTARGAPRAQSPAHLRVHFARQILGAHTHLLFQGAAGARPRDGAGVRAGAVFAVRLQVAHGAGGGVGGGEEKGTPRASAAPGPSEEVGRGAVSGALRGCGAGWRWGLRGAVKGSRRVGLGSHQVWRVRRRRHWEPERSRSGRRLRLFTATRECARGGGGGRGPEPASAGARPAPSPSLPAVSGGTCSQSPQPTAGSPRPGPWRASLWRGFSPLFLVLFLSLSHLSPFPSPRLVFKL